MPIAYIRDKETRNIEYVEESYSSLIWTERYQEAGEFEMTIPLDDANMDMYKCGNYITLDDSRESMVIESVDITDGDYDDSGSFLIVSGRSLSSILMRRVNASRVFDTYSGDIAGAIASIAAVSNPGISYSGELSQVLTSLFNDDVIDPVVPVYKWYGRGSLDEAFTEGFNYSAPFSPKYLDIREVMVKAKERKIDNLVFENSMTSYNPQVDKTYSKVMTVYDILVSLSKAYIFGFKSKFDSENNIVITTYKGVDRTSNQKTLDPVIFNPIMDNIIYVNYYEDQTNYKTTPLVYSNSGLNYAMLKATHHVMMPEYDTYLYSGYNWSNNSGYTGLDRYEVPIDITDDVSVVDLVANKRVESLYKSDSEETSEETSEDDYMSWPDYYEAIENSVPVAGNDAFEEGDYELVKTAEGAIDPLARYTIDSNYFLGDIVEISNDRGIVMTCIIDEVVRSYDENGIVVTPNFKDMTEYDYGEEEE